jgi:hypothetical protein
MTQHDVAKLLSTLPLSERAAALVCTIVERDGDAVVVVNGLAALLAKMSEGLSAKRRFAVSEKLRDVADHLEAPAVATVR